MRRVRAYRSSGTHLPASCSLRASRERFTTVYKRYTSTEAKQTQKRFVYQVYQILRSTRNIFYFSNFRLEQQQQRRSYLQFHTQEARQSDQDNPSSSGLFRLLAEAPPCPDRSNAFLFTCRLVLLVLCHPFSQEGDFALPCLAPPRPPHPKPLVRSYLYM